VLAHDLPHNAAVQGLDVSRGDVLQHQLLQAQLTHQSLQLAVLLLQLLQTPSLVHLQPTVLLAPPVVRLLSFSADSVQSPWEWVATAHPPGNVWSAALLQAKSSDDEKWSAAMYSACDEAIASDHDVLRALLFLSSVSASSALPKDRLQAGPI
jgi:hypothetical protein